MVSMILIWIVIWTSHASPDLNHDLDPCFVARVALITVMTSSLSLSYSLLTEFSCTLSSSMRGHTEKTVQDYQIA